MTRGISARRATERNLGPILLATTLASLATLLPGRPAAGQCTHQRFDILTALDGGVGYEFGYSMHFRGDVLLVGARSDRERGFRAGAVYVYRRQADDRLLLEQKLLASDARAEHWFGADVTSFGDMAAVGAVWDGAAREGAVYVYRHSGGHWSEIQKITSPAPQPEEYFGKSVALFHRTLVISQRHHTVSGNDFGTVFVYTFDGIRWKPAQQLTAADGIPGHYFGREAALHADVLLVSAHNDDDRGTNAGAVYAYRRRGGQWSLEQKITASSSGSLLFGFDVAVHGHTALVGSPGDSNYRGAAYWLDYDGNQWVERQRLAASDGAVEDRFGFDVSFDDAVAAISAPGDDDRGDLSGSVYVKRFDGQRWVEASKHTQWDERGRYDALGFETAVEGNLVAVSTPSADQLDVQAGAVYLLRERGFTLEVSPTVVPPGAPVSFDIGAGKPGQPVLLAVVEETGAGSLRPVASWVFGRNCDWVLHSVGAPGMSGQTVTFQSVGIDLSGRLAATDRVTVVFQ